MRHGGVKRGLSPVFPLTGIGLPYGSALGVYIGGVGGKVFDFYKEVSGAK
ncbi:hypothetical protein RS3R6_23230 [Pseudomonas atacamensis]|jgi:hypothetical protein|uniref:Uncharacterized protein n=1 Tax=Pseudomonas atacamensis TaxID=2565368 RepID=A0ABQ5PGE7_9PSED|nr:hypothetical protein RS3R1_16470 [Pseudomonas atacamensis]GLH54141.1 hypothetical protein RS3R6_23230 [Pseudomonas atacamensis]